MGCGGVCGLPRDGGGGGWGVDRGCVCEGCRDGAELLTGRGCHCVRGSEADCGRCQVSRCQVSRCQVSRLMAGVLARPASCNKLAPLDDGGPTETETLDPQCSLPLGRAATSLYTIYPHPLSQLTRRMKKFKNQRQGIQELPRRYGWHTCPSSSSDVHDRQGTEVLPSWSERRPYRPETCRDQPRLCLPFLTFR